MDRKSQNLKWLLLLVGGALLAGIGWWLLLPAENKMLFPGKVEKAPELPYLKYSFTQLAARAPASSQIEIGRVIATYPEFVSHVFYYKSGGKKISGQINIPTSEGKKAIIIMARGFVPKEGYLTGIGTKNGAAVYAKNGYITLAPDFLGYAESEMEDKDSIGARLYRPVEILDLLASLNTLPQADPSKVFLWGHSNGGQIMLSVAEIWGKSDPRGRTSRVLGVVLWAPVSKPFPFSILAFSDEADDQGKALRRVVSEFERFYDVYDYSIDRYFDWINIPIQLHQGTADPEVFKVWSDDLVATLKEKKKAVTYFTYPGMNHNMNPGWDTVVARDVTFYAKTITNE